MKCEALNLCSKVEVTTCYCHKNGDTCKSILVQFSTTGSMLECSWVEIIKVKYILTWLYHQ